MAKSKLKKELGLYDVFAISTGAMFSSGFFQGGNKRDTGFCHTANHGIHPFFHPRIVRRRNCQTGQYFPALHFYVY
jgi:hypothetical protein